jgi:hypothetical protein
VSPVLGVELWALDAIGFTLIKPAPQPVIQSVVNTGNSVVITWSTVSGQNYQMQDETNMTTPSWTNLGSAVAATGSTASFTNTIGPDAHRYYRVQVVSGGSPSVVMHQSQVSSSPTGSGTNYLSGAGQ